MTKLKLKKDPYICRNVLSDDKKEIVIGSVFIITSIMLFPDMFELNANRLQRGISERTYSSLALNMMMGF